MEKNVYHGVPWDEKKFIKSLDYKKMKTTLKIKAPEEQIFMIENDTDKPSARLIQYIKDYDMLVDTLFSRVNPDHSFIITANLYKREDAVQYLTTFIISGEVYDQDDMDNYDAMLEEFESRIYK